MGVGYRGLTKQTSPKILLCRIFYEYQKKKKNFLPFPKKKHIYCTYSENFTFYILSDSMKSNKVERETDNTIRKLCTCPQVC